MLAPVHTATSGIVRVQSSGSKAADVKSGSRLPALNHCAALHLSVTLSLTMSTARAQNNADRLGEGSGLSWAGKDTGEGTFPATRVPRKAQQYVKGFEGLSKLLHFSIKDLSTDTTDPA